MDVISRSQWGARPARNRAIVKWPKGVTLWVHHTAGPANQTPAQIQAYHMDVNGWSDIGYSYLIDTRGRVYEGRGRNVQGAHSPGKNHEPSVALIGDYSKGDPNLAQHQAVYDLMDLIGAGRLRGHRDNTATSCPGDAAYRMIVKGPPPKRPGKKLTLKQRLMKAGFGGKSADAILRALGRK